MQKNILLLFQQLQDFLREVIVTVGSLI